ncbi:LOW QUALITY PROTEIN: hypothetical protein SETIT_4G123800v2 [Setaria italica]|uniref:Uncharacterized protein n=1 Tax=Setaria italica TaxID=4555 RepID=A0A368QTF8_SETIT|nr:LOW QUALITY PROTEIN: hypothetical protein SETIT_4G123800v2 [Setaria italica]
MQPPPVADDDPDCTFGRCLCSWLRSCSSRVPPVGPGRDYERVPIGADDSAARPLRRVLGRSDDALEILDDVDYDAKGDSAQISAAAAATPSPDGRSLALCLFCLDFGVPSGKVESPLLLPELNADKRISLHPLPPLPPRPFMPIRPISAAGDLWAPGFLKHCGPTSLVMLRLDKESEQWVQVAAMEAQHCVINGYAVTNNNCSTAYAWKCGQLVTDYIPIRGRGVYVEEDDTIYLLCGSLVYAYKLCQDQDGCQYRMDQCTYSVASHR